MVYQKYTTKYVEELPKVGEPCPLCESGIVGSGKYSPYCSKCQVYFNLSKYPIKDGEEEVEEKKEVPVLEETVKKVVVKVLSDMIAKAVEDAEK